MVLARLEKFIAPMMSPRYSGGKNETVVKKHRQKARAMLDLARSTRTGTADGVDESTLAIRSKHDSVQVVKDSM